MKANYRKPVWRTHNATIAAIGIICVLPSMALAQQSTELKTKSTEPIVTDRPDFTESTETVPPGMTQIEGGYTYTHNEPHDNSQSIGELLIRVPTGNKTELRIGLNSYDRDSGPTGTVYGLEDIGLGVKIRLRESAEGGGLRSPAVSVIALTSLPTGTGAKRGNALQPTIKLCLGFNLSNRLDLGVNANYSYVADDTGHYSLITPTASFAYALTDRVGSYFEYYGFYPVRNQSATHYLNTGLTYLLNHDTQLDMRVGTRLNGATDNFFIGTGAAQRF